MRPLKVTIHLKTPAFIENNRMLTLDRLSAGLLSTTAPADEIHIKDSLSEIFYQKNNTFASSIFFIKKDSPIIFDSRTYYLNPSHSRKYYVDILDKKINKDIYIGTGSGKFRSFQSTFYSLYTPSIYFYVNANEDKLSDVLKRLKYIGKKARFGFGKVSGFEIESVKEDKSFLLNEYTPSRPLPISSWDTIKTDRIALFNITTAWDRSGLEPCYMPPVAYAEKPNKKHRQPIYAKNITISGTRFALMYGGYTIKQSKIPMVKNDNSSACALCGRKAEQGVFLQGKTGVSNITSNGFTDYLLFNFKLGSNFVCEDCLKVLASYSSTLTSKRLLITTKGVREKVKVEDIIFNTPDDEYLYLGYSGANRKHIIPSSIPSISKGMYYNNKDYRMTNLVDTVSLIDAINFINNNDISRFRMSNQYYGLKDEEFEKLQELYKMIDIPLLKELSYIPDKFLAQYKKDKETKNEG